MKLLTVKEMQASMTQNSRNLDYSKLALCYLSVLLVMFVGAIILSPIK